MTTIDWALICDLAYFDRAHQLCMMGVETSGAVRTLPLGVHRLTMAIHFRDRDLHAHQDVALFVTAPDGEWRMADIVSECCVQSSGEYLLVSMRNVSLQQEGTYRFELACGACEPVVCEVSVLAEARRTTMTHFHGVH